MCVRLFKYHTLKILYKAFLSEQDKKIARSFCHQGLHKKDEMAFKLYEPVSIMWRTRWTDCNFVLIHTYMAFYHPTRGSFFKLYFDLF